MRWLAFDIGGANLKIADGQGYAVSVAFPLWKEPGRLTEKLRQAIEQAPPSDQIAVTMTGELADCFATKQEGVTFIVEAVQAAADARGLKVYINTGVLVGPEIVLQNPLLGAATNWHALASYAGRYVREGTTLLIDAGSTTCDIIPIEHGGPATDAVDDLQRLLTGQLLYTGVERSPGCAILQTVRYRNAECPIAQDAVRVHRGDGHERRRADSARSVLERVSIPVHSGRRPHDGRTGCRTTAEDAGPQHSFGSGTAPRTSFHSGRFRRGRVSCASCARAVGLYR